MNENEFYNKMNFSNSIITRFFESIFYPGNVTDCWLWFGYCNKFGYGIFNLDNKHIKAHRFIYECYNGPIPKGLFVCHTCDNPKCVNPNHLFLGTDLDNKLDMIDKNRQAFGSKNGMAILNDENVIEILENIKNGIYTSIQQICSIYSIAESPIRDILDRKLWKHITINFTDLELDYLKNKIKSKRVKGVLQSNDVIEIKLRLNNGEGLASIARDFRVSERTIYGIKNNEIWKSIIV